MKKKSMILLIVMLAIGFAAVSTTLIINGVVGIGTNPNNFVDGVVFDEESLRSTEGATVSLSESGRTITFTTHEMTRIDETATVYFKIKNYSQYDATLGNPAISCYFVNSYEVDKKAEVKSTENEYMDLIPGHELDGTTINAGGSLSEESSVTVKQTKSYIGDAQEVKFQCEINASAGDSETPGINRPNKLPKEVELVTDVDGDGRADIGDEIRVGTENFYVISRSNTELNALAKYNLKVGNIYSADGNTKESTIQTTEEGYGKQDSQIRGEVIGEKRSGTVAFSKEKGWLYENNDTIDIRDEKYRVGSGVTAETMTVLDALYTSNETTGIKGYEKYIQETIPDASLRLITKREIEVLVNDGNALTDNINNIKSTADAKGYSWLYYSGYWTQSAYFDSDDGVWRMHTDGGYFGSYFYYDSRCGVRPVITIPLS